MYSPEWLAEDLARRAAFAVDNALLYEKSRIAVGEREDVLSVVSHDLRNPLGNILMSAALCNGKSKTRDSRKSFCAPSGGPY